MPDSSRDQAAVIGELDRLHARQGEIQRQMLRCIADADRHQVWWQAGARDLAHLLGMRYGISSWRAPVTWTPGGRTRWWRCARRGSPPIRIPTGPRWWSTPPSTRWPATAAGARWKAAG